MDESLAQRRRSLAALGMTLTVNGDSSMGDPLTVAMGELTHLAIETEKEIRIIKEDELRWEEEKKAMQSQIDSLLGSVSPMVGCLPIPIASGIACRLFRSSLDSSGLRPHLAGGSTESHFTRMEDESAAASQSVDEMIASMGTASSLTRRIAKEQIKRQKEILEQVTYEVTSRRAGIDDRID